VESLETELLRGRSDTPSLRSVVSRTWLVWSLAELGAFPEGIVRAREGIKIAEAINRPDSLINAYSGIGFLFLRKGDLSEAISLLERGFGFYQDWQIPLLFPLVASALGAAYALSGRVAEALPLLEQAVAHAASMKVMDFQSYRLACLGEAHLLSGRTDEAMALAVHALGLSGAHKERGWEAYALRLLGDIAAQREPPEVEHAEEHYRQALVLAEELGMRPLVAHCHFGLGTLYTKISRRDQAGAELCTAIELFRAMEMTFWLTRAEHTLAQKA
jgi:tetratricopeptide (TPR) repeat protein